MMVFLVTSATSATQVVRFCLWPTPAQVVRFCLWPTPAQVVRFCLWPTPAQVEEHRAGFLVPPLPLTRDRPVTGPSSHSEETKDVIHQDSAVLFTAYYKINEKRVSWKWLRCPLLCHWQQQDHHKVLSERRSVIIMSYIILILLFFIQRKTEWGQLSWYSIWLKMHMQYGCRFESKMRQGIVILHQFPVPTFLWCPYSPHVQLCASTSVCTFKIPNTGSHTIVLTQENTAHTDRNG